jgi:small redox-active disulfide protein 2
MKTIQILGPGCVRCRKLTENVEAALRELGLAEIAVEKVTDLGRIAAMGAMMTPALAVDGRVRSSGHLLSVHQVKGILADT